MQGLSDVPCAWKRFPGMEDLFANRCHEPMEKLVQYSVQQFMYPGLRISSVAATSIAVGYALASNE
ncbi:MAG: hypothetical protein K0S36_857 [Nitrosospira multiformis]|jgi:hypothetical protein|nr:hypothetical protein [Nitrosospira multiformis]